MDELQIPMANLQVDGDDSSDSDDYPLDYPFTRTLFTEEKYNIIDDNVAVYDYLFAVKKSLMEIWRLIELNPENNREVETFPYLKKKDASKSHFPKKDYWLSFLNQFFCASFDSFENNFDEHFKQGMEEDKQAMIVRELQIGLTTKQRNGVKGWFNNLCRGVKLETGVQIGDKPIFFDDEDYLPFKFSRDSFEDRFQALMCDFGHFDPCVVFAKPGTRSPYSAKKKLKK
jgi:hypothetical protein